jgi:phosphoribosylaminoimidazolecarboxamide formyltransferase / IMP cyclohydrolase
MPPSPDRVRPRRALLSVTDKAKLADLAKALSRHGIELISTGGTAKALATAGLAVTSIDSVTGFPEILDGRVKTLHPKVHGGILAVRDLPAHAASIAEHGISPIDIVVINLYPFQHTVAQADCTRPMAIENIDIGGPSMIRSAAKNHGYVAVVTDPGDYDRLIHELDTSEGHLSLAFREELAAKAFALTAAYDSAIAEYLSRQPARTNDQAHDVRFPPAIVAHYTMDRPLRYGENPHQQAALYRSADQGSASSVVAARQLHGKELSYNNLNDAAAAWQLALQLRSLGLSDHAACVIKHANPCGAAVADSAHDAADEAIASDPIAAYGGILAITSPVDVATATRLAQKDIFLEVLIAPAIHDDALEILRARSANIRILQCPLPLADSAARPGLEFKPIPGGLLVQEADTRLTDRGGLQHHAGPAPTPAQIRAAAFLEPVVRALLSNAIVIGGISPTRPTALRMFGAGAGQMDRLTSCSIAVQKSGANAAGAVAFSDAFFPFADGPTILADAGVGMIVHPGGSKRDADTFALCNARGVSCVTTGIRHFRH